MVIGATTAYINFGQPMYIGVAARRDILLVLASTLLFSYVLEKNKEREFHNALIFFCKAYLVIVVLVNFTIEPSLFVNIYGIDNEYVKFFIDYSESLSAYRYKFAFLPVLVIISMVFWNKEVRRKNDLFFILLSLFWLLFLYGGRGLIIGTLLSLILPYMFFSSINKKILALLISMFFLISFLLLVGNSNFLDSRLEAIGSAVDVVMSAGKAEQISDVSAMSRIIQFEALSKHFNIITLLFGIGHLSHNWNGGFEGVLGRFHPADLGIVGVTAVYGLIAVAIYLIPLGLIVKEMLKNKKPTVVYWVVQLSILTVLTGYSVIQPASTLLIYLFIVSGDRVYNTGVLK